MARVNAKRATKPNSREDRNKKNNNNNNVLSVNFETNKKKNIPLIPKSVNQEDMVDALNDANTHIVVASGVAGSGKTFLAAHWSVNALYNGDVDRLILIRPNVGCDDEQIGHLPGDVNEKMYSILSSIWDSLELYYSKKEIENLIETGKIVPLPLAFVRGRSLSNSAIILEEAQGTTPNSMLAVLTRISEGSKLIITGDVKQKDRKTANGLEDLIEKLNRNDIDGISHIMFDENDIQRHPIISDILKMYDE